MFINLYDGAAFSLYAPICWNSLPEDLRTTETTAVFEHKFKTYLFRLLIKIFYACVLSLTSQADVKHFEVRKVLY